MQISTFYYIFQYAAKIFFILKGHRAPYLQSGGDSMFQAIKNLNMTYDSTMPTSAMSPPIWPFTLDYGVTHVLRIITFFR